MEQERQVYRFVFYLKALGALLVLNSHLDEIYPIQALATGGALGNALFFAVSGFCLSNVPDKLGKWYGRRLRRIYEPAILMALVYLLSHEKIERTLPAFAAKFLWPTRFWFVGAMALYYLLFFLLRGVKRGRDFVLLGAVLSAAYALYYVCLLDTSVWVIETPGLDSVEGCFKLIFYFAIMMLGKFMALHRNWVMKRSASLLHVALSVVSLYGFKLLMSRIPMLMHLQFLNQISVVWFTVSVFSLGLQLEETLQNRQKCWDFKIVSVLAGLTFEIYLTQYLVIHYSKDLPFPISLLVTLIGTFAAAVLLKRIIHSWDGRMDHAVFAWMKTGN